MNEAQVKAETTMILGKQIHFLSGCVIGALENDDPVAASFFASQLHSLVGPRGGLGMWVKLGTRERGMNHDDVQREHTNRFDELMQVLRDSHLWSTEAFE